MGSDWPVVKLGDIVDFKTGKLNSNAATDDGQYPFFTCSPETLRIDKYAFDCEAVLLAGNNANGVFSVKYFNGKFNAYQRTYVIIPKSDIKIDIKWLYFQIQHVTNIFQKLSVGTATKFLTKQILDSFEIKLPPLNYQKNIANQLWSLLIKEDINRQINQTLEQMAQTLFKSWFVDFDPVIDNALDAGNAIPDELKARAEQRQALRNGTTQQGDASATPVGNAKPLPDNIRQLFPSEFEESELGWVPKGWGVDTLSSISEVIMGQSPKGDTYNNDGVGSPLVNGPVEFGAYHPVKSKWTISPTKFSKCSDLIVCVRGSTTGRYVISDGMYCLGRGVCAIRNEEIQPFVTYLFKHKIPSLLGLATGSTFPSWSGPTLKNSKVIKPTFFLIKKYCEITDVSLSKMALLDSEINQLTQIRDTLLPKLISGELRLNEVESTIEETITA